MPFSDEARSCLYLKFHVWNHHETPKHHRAFLGFGDFHKPPDSLCRHQVQPFANQNGGIDDTLGRPGFPDGLGFLHVSSMQPHGSESIWDFDELIVFDWVFGKLHAATWLDSIGIVARKMTRIRNLVIQKFNSQLSVCNQDFPLATLSCRSTKNLYVWSSGQPFGPFLRGGLQSMAFCWQNGAATTGRPGLRDFEKILGLLKKIPSGK